MSCNLVWTSIALIPSNFDDRGLVPLLITQNISYSVSVCPNNVSSTFTFNTASAIFFITLSSAFIWSAKFYLVITITSSMYTRTTSKMSKILDIFSWKIAGLLHTPIGSFWVLILPSQEYHSTYQVIS